MSTPYLPWDDDEGPPSRQAPPADARPSPFTFAADPAPAPGQSAIRIVCTAASADRLQLVREALAGSAVADLLIVAPTHAQADEVARSAGAGHEATAGWHRAGMTELMLRLSTPRLAEEGVTPLAPLGMDAVVVRALGVLHSSEGLGALDGAAAHPGFLGALAATLTDLRLAGVQAADLASAGTIGGDLARCAMALDAALTNLRQADRARLAKWALEAVRHGAVPVPTRGSTPVVVVDPVCASRLELELLVAVISAAPRALVVGPAGDPGLQALARALGCEIETGSVAHSRPASLSRAQQWLFAPADPPVADAGPDDSVELFSAPGEGRECAEVVRRLLAAAGAGVPFDQMAVVLRAPQLYASHLETACRRAEVPYWFSRGTRRPDPSGRALLALVSCAREDLSAGRFAEYLSLGQVPAPTGATSEADAPQRSPWRWEALLNDAVVIGSQDRWRRRLEGFRQELLTRADLLAEEEPETGRVLMLRRRADLVEELVAFALPLLDELAAWRGTPAPWGVWLDRLTALAGAALSHPEHVVEVLAELRPMSEVADVGLDDVYDVLRERLTQMSIPPPESRYGRVFVGTPDDLRGRSFRLVCIPGLSERVFPQRSRQDPLLLDERRAAVSPWLVTDDRRVADERLRLHLAVGAASERLVTSFASFDSAQARPRVPSFYALDIQRACGGVLPGYERVLREAQRASGARLAWPAPADPSTAIDGIEHDLSMLHHYLRGPEEDVRGRARYLFEDHPSMRRSLVMRHDRGRRKWTSGDGLVTDAHSAPLLASSLARHRLQARAYSVSALQRFAVCPYQFYLSTIVRLAPRDEPAPVTSLDPLTRGSIVHEVLAGVMRAFQQQGWLPLTADRLEEAMAIGERIVDDVVERHRDRLVPPIERIWLDEVQAIRRDTREWVRRLPDDQQGWTPSFVELGFGFGRGDGRDPASLPEDVVLEGGERLHGVIDLVERGPDETWRITDYKTGRNRLPDYVLINKGETLQPALYAAALEQAVGGRVVASRLWYCTLDGGYSERHVPVDTAQNGQARERAQGVLEAVDRAVDTGFLPAAPRREACRWCDFTSVCGPNAQTQTSHKERASLGDLLLIRSQR